MKQHIPYRKEEGPDFVVFPHEWENDGEVSTAKWSGHPETKLMVVSKDKKQVIEITRLIHRKLLEDEFIILPSKYVKFDSDNLIVVEDVTINRFEYRYKHDKGFHGAEIYPLIELCTLLEGGRNETGRLAGVDIYDLPKNPRCEITTNWERFSYFKDTLLPFIKEKMVKGFLKKTPTYEFIKLVGCGPPDYSQKPRYYPLVELVYYPDGSVFDNTVYCSYDGDYSDEKGFKEEILERKYEDWDRLSVPRYFRTDHPYWEFPSVYGKIGSTGMHNEGFSLSAFIKNEERDVNAFEQMFEQLSMKISKEILSGGFVPAIQEMIPIGKNRYKDKYHKAKESDEKPYIFRNESLSPILHYLKGDIIGSYNLILEQEVGIGKEYNIKGTLGVAFRCEEHYTTGVMSMSVRDLSKFNIDWFLYFKEKILLLFKETPILYADLSGIAPFYLNHKKYHAVIMLIMFPDGTLIDRTVYCNKKNEYLDKQGLDIDLLHEIGEKRKKSETGKQSGKQIKSEKPDLVKLKRKKEIDGLINALTYKDAKIRRYAADALGDLKDPKAVDALIKALDDEKEIVGIHALRALGEIEDPKVTEGLLNALENKSTKIRGEAAWMFERNPDERAVEALIKLLKDKSSLVRGYAAGALGAIKDQGAFEPLFERLEDKNKFAQKHAILAIGNLKNPKALPKLFHILNTAEKEYTISEMRMAASCAIAKIGKESSIDNLIDIIAKEDKFLIEILHALWITNTAPDDPKLIKTLHRVLECNTQNIPLTAVMILGKIKNKASVEPLIKILENKNYNVRREVANALGEINDERAVEPLKKLLKDEYSTVCQSAANAIEKITGEKYKHK